MSNGHGRIACSVRIRDEGKEDFILTCLGEFGFEACGDRTVFALAVMAVAGADEGRRGYALRPGARDFGVGVIHGDTRELLAFAADGLGPRGAVENLSIGK